MPVEEQVCVIFAGTQGLIDEVPLADVGRFEQELLNYLRDGNSELMDGIRTSGELDDAAEDALRQAIEAFKANAFVATSDSASGE